MYTIQVKSPKKQSLDHQVSNPPFRGSPFRTALQRACSWLNWLGAVQYNIHNTFCSFCRNAHVIGDLCSKTHVTNSIGASSSRNNRYGLLYWYVHSTFHDIMSFNRIFCLIFRMAVVTYQPNSKPQTTSRLRTCHAALTVGPNR